MAKFIINGGKKLKGKVKTNSAKNSTVAILCATTMIPGKTTLVDVPVIEEVKRIIEVLTSIGMKIRWTDKDKLEVYNPGKLNLNKLDKEAFIRTRSALLLIGALSGLKKDFSLPRAGGCKLGKRTVNPYILAMDHLGIKVKETEVSYEITNKNSKATEFAMYESSDTGTENTIMAAAQIKGTTKLHFAACNYMVQDLCYFLQKAGVKFKGIGSTTLEITGTDKLKPVKDYSIIPDPIESMAFISIGITTGSKIKVTGCPLDFLRLELEKLRVMGQKFKISKPYKSKNGQFDLVDVEVIPGKLYALADKIYGRPYPGLNMDNLPLMVPIFTQAQGRTLVHDWPYENRAIYLVDMNKLGANVTLMDPHRALIDGPTELKNGELICPEALRPSVNLLICMLAAKGKSVLHNIYPIERGYEAIEKRLRSLGADVRRQG